MDGDNTVHNRNAGPGFRAALKYFKLQRSHKQKKADHAYQQPATQTQAIHGQAHNIRACHPHTEKIQFRQKQAGISIDSKIFVDTFR